VLTVFGRVRLFVLVRGPDSQHKDDQVSASHRRIGGAPSFRADMPPAQLGSARLTRGGTTSALVVGDTRAEPNGLRPVSCLDSVERMKRARPCSYEPYPPSPVQSTPGTVRCVPSSRSAIKNQRRKTSGSMPCRIHWPATIPASAGAIARTDNPKSSASNPADPTREPARG
jgi:hypothetical protein